MTRPELLERYQALPLPTTRDEAWRFTDLKDFDPDSFGHDPSPGLGTGPAETMLEIAVSGLAHVSESSIQIERAPEGVTFAPLVDHPRLHELVGWDEKFAAHNAALWEYGLLVVVPRDTVLDEPLYVRIANAVDGGSLFWRLLVVAEAGSRFTLIEEYASAHAEVAGYSNAVVELFVEDGAEHDERLRLQGRAARRGVDGVARDDPRRTRCAEDERVPGEPQPAAVALCA